MESIAGTDSQPGSSGSTTAKPVPEIIAPRILSDFTEQLGTSVEDQRKWWQKQLTNALSKLPHSGDGRASDASSEAVSDIYHASSALLALNKKADWVRAGATLLAHLRRIPKEDKETARKSQGGVWAGQNSYHVEGKDTISGPGGEHTSIMPFNAYDTFKTLRIAIDWERPERNALKVSKASISVDRKTSDGFISPDDLAEQAYDANPDMGSNGGTLGSFLESTLDFGFNRSDKATENRGSALALLRAIAGEKVAQAQQESSEAASSANDYDDAQLATLAVISLAHQFEMGPGHKGQMLAEDTFRECLTSLKGSRKDLALATFKIPDWKYAHNASEHESSSEGAFGVGKLNSKGKPSIKVSVPEKKLAETYSFEMRPH